MAQFLSHPETKQELTIYVASKTVSYFSVNTTAKKVNVTAGTSTQNNQQETPQFHNQIKWLQLQTEQIALHGNVRMFCSRVHQHN
jgi:hypothetical protein